MLKISLFFKKNTNFTGVNKSIIVMIKNAKFSGYYFYKNSNIFGDFQICISVPLMIFEYVLLDSLMTCLSFYIECFNDVFECVILDVLMTYSSV